MAAGVRRTTFYLRCLEVCDSVSRFMTGELEPVSAGYKNKLFLTRERDVELKSYIFYSLSTKTRAVSWYEHRHRVKIWHAFQHSPEQVPLEAALGVKG